MVESTSSLPKNSKICRGGTHATMPSHSLSSRRRRNKTVHFGDTLMSEVRAGEDLRTASGPESGCESRGSVVSLPGQFDYNVQQLFTFIGTVLSAWDKDETSSEPCSSSRSSSHHNHHNHQSSHHNHQHSSHHNHQSSGSRRRRQPNILNYLLNGENSLEGDDHLCSPTFKHKHCKLAPGSCNALFLRKVGIYLFTVNMYLGRF